MTSGFSEWEHILLSDLVRSMFVWKVLTVCNDPVDGLVLIIIKCPRVTELTTNVFEYGRKLGI